MISVKKKILGTGLVVLSTLGVGYGAELSPEAMKKLNAAVSSSTYQSFATPVLYRFPIIDPDTAVKVETSAVLIKEIETPSSGVVSTPLLLTASFTFSGKDIAESGKIVDGGGQTLTATPGTPYAFKVKKGTKRVVLRNMTLEGFDTAIVSEPNATLVLENVKISGAKAGGVIVGSPSSISKTGSFSGKKTTGEIPIFVKPLPPLGPEGISPTLPPGFTMTVHPQPAMANPQAAMLMSGATDDLPPDVSEMCNDIETATNDSAVIQGQVIWSGTDNEIKNSGGVIVHGDGNSLCIVAGAKIAIHSNTSTGISVRDDGHLVIHPTAEVVVTGVPESMRSNNGIENPQTVGIDLGGEKESCDGCSGNSTGFIDITEQAGTVVTADEAGVATDTSPDAAATGMLCIAHHANHGIEFFGNGSKLRAHPGAHVVLAHNGIPSITHSKANPPKMSAIGLSLKSRKPLVCYSNTPLPKVFFKGKGVNLTTVHLPNTTPRHPPNHEERLKALTPTLAQCGTATAFPEMGDSPSDVGAAIINRCANVAECVNKPPPNSSVTDCLN